MPRLQTRLHASLRATLSTIDTLAITSMLPGIFSIVRAMCLIFPAE
jgi:hypothetical protein